MDVSWRSARRSEHQAWADSFVGEFAEEVCQVVVRQVCKVGQADVGGLPAQVGQPALAGAIAEVVLPAADERLRELDQLILGEPIAQGGQDVGLLAPEVVVGPVGDVGQDAVEDRAVGVDASQPDQQVFGAEVFALATADSLRTTGVACPVRRPLPPRRGRARPAGWSARPYLGGEESILTVGAEQPRANHKIRWFRTA